MAVVGPHDGGARLAAEAEAVGAELARRGAVVVCGGLGGVMEAACRGAKGAGGTTLGILPGDGPLRRQRVGGRGRGHRAGRGPQRARGARLRRAGRGGRRLWHPLRGGARPEDAAPGDRARQLGHPGRGGRGLPGGRRRRRARGGVADDPPVAVRHAVPRRSARLRGARPGALPRAGAQGRAGRRPRAARRARTRGAGARHPGAHLRHRRGRRPHAVRAGPDPRGRGVGGQARMVPRERRVAGQPRGAARPRPPRAAR